MKKLLLKNCQLHDYKENQDILISNGEIEKIDKNISICETDFLDIQGNLVVPGFVDLHIHGAGGGEVFKAEFDNLNKMTATLAKCGVTSITPTSVVNPANDYHQIRQLKKLLQMDYSVQEYWVYILKGLL